MTDFELASISAIGSVFPDCERKGCYFHFSQCLFRHIRELPTLYQKYNNDDVFALQVRMLAASAFVPISLVTDSFEMILTS